MHGAYLSFFDQFLLAFTDGSCSVALIETFNNLFVFVLVIFVDVILFLQLVAKECRLHRHYV